MDAQWCDALALVGLGNPWHFECAGHVEFVNLRKWDHFGEAIMGTIDAIAVPARLDESKTGVCNRKLSFESRQFTRKAMRHNAGRHRWRGPVRSLSSGL